MKFQFNVTREYNVFQTKTFSVDAETEEEAKDKIMEQLFNNANLIPILITSFDSEEEQDVYIEFCDSENEFELFEDED